MARRRDRREPGPRRPDGRQEARPRALAIAVVLAALHALWALFQWTQLVVARAGGDASCGIGGSDRCVAVWDSRFAIAVERWTVLPVAGWGLAWSLVAFALILWVLVRRAGARDPEPVWTAVLLTALAGFASVVALVVASVAFGQFCPSCVVTYALVVAYAAVCFWEARQLGFAAPLRGVPLAVGATFAAYLALLHPGLRTPQAATTALRGSGLSGVSLAEMVAGLSPENRQILSDSLDRYAETPRLPLPPPRLLLGAPDAPVRVTEFSDVLCSHCANLHKTLARLGELLPAGSFSLELRQFPLDSACNPLIPGDSRFPVRCTAARAQICMEDSPHAFDFSSALFESQRTLTDQKVYALAALFVSPADLKSCVGAEETNAKLQADIAWAAENGIRGTPLVLVNGGEAPHFAPFLFAIVLSGGNVEHRAFADLPPPRRRPRALDLPEG